MAEQKKRGPGRPPGSKNKKTSSTSGTRQSSAPKTKQEHIEDIQLQIDRDRRTVDVIWSVSLFALGIFLLFTVVFDSTGAFGMKMHDICLGLFGIMAYVLPFLFLASGALLLMGKLQHIGGRTVTCGILIFFQMCILNSYRFINEKLLAYGFADIVKYFKLAVEGKEGGAVGMELGSLLVKFFGKPGLIIIAVSILIICIFLVANTPISKFFSNMSNKREKRKLMAELEAAEQAKVQQAVAATSHAYAPVADPVPVIKADPVTDILPPPEISKGARAVDMQDTFVSPKNIAASSSGGFFSKLKRNTLFSSVDEKKKDASEYDSEKVGKDADREPERNIAKEFVPQSAAREGYGLGDPDDYGHSGSYGLGGDDSYSITGRVKRNSASSKKKTSGVSTGLVDENVEDIAPSKHVKAEDIPAETETPEPPKVPKASPVVAATVNTVKEDKKSDAETETMAEELNAALNTNENDENYRMPPVDLLKKGTSGKQMMSDIQLEEKANLLEQTLKDFGVDATCLSVTQGASVTRYEVQPATGVKVSKITALADDIALNLRAKSIRIEAPIPGKAAVGIEVENDKPAPVLVRDLIESEEFASAQSKLSFVVGKDISGGNIIADMKSMPHLLIAGATGSGKSVCINTIIASFLYKARPNELKLIMIDPKVVELQSYNGIPHMLVPVVTDPRKAAKALAIAVEEMNKRYEAFAKYGVKDLESYNEYMIAEQEYANVKPQIVIIIDELADLMMACSNEVENSICRLAQKARAAGMHLIVATQRPSVDVVTGLIKANIPSRIAFSVSSQFDSRTILDMAGAEKLLGKGDMLFSPVGSNKPLRVQGPFISEAESNKLIKFVKQQGGDAVYDKEVQNAIDSDGKDNAKSGIELEDELTEDAIAFILKSKQASVSMLQRRFRIGYNRAARIIDEIEAKGIIGPSDGSRPRQVLMTEDEYYGGTEEVFEEDPGADEAVSEGTEYEQSEKNAGITAFDSLPESVQKEIMNSDD